MPGTVCPKGHESVDPDFCSVCGAKMPVPGQNEPVCPDCGAKREPGAGIFCEICGYNFSTGAHGELKPATDPVPEATQDTPALCYWELVVSVDPGLRTPESPEPPKAFDPVVIPLQRETNLIGRRSERRAIDPEISLDQDDAVSHRHALLTQAPGCTLLLRDVGSSNGTSLNGAAIPALTDAPVKDGDVVTLGHWTRIVVRAVR